MWIIMNTNLGINISVIKAIMNANYNCNINN